MIDHPGNAGGPVAARTTVAPDLATARAAIAARQGVLLLHERGMPQLPVIVGLLQPTTALDAELGDSPAVAYVDGQRMEVEGRDEVVLRCGAASITPRRNGRVVIRGTTVETRASGTNRIKGGSVQIKAHSWRTRPKRSFGTSSTPDPPDRSRRRHATADARIGDCIGDSGSVRQPRGACRGVGARRRGGARAARAWRDGRSVRSRGLVGNTAPADRDGRHARAQRVGGKPKRGRGRARGQTRSSAELRAARTVALAVEVVAAPERRADARRCPRG